MKTVYKNKIVASFTFTISVVYVYILTNKTRENNILIGSFVFSSEK